jgi:hypothetical protein
MQTKNMHCIEFATALEATLLQSVKKNFPYSWREDQISTDILRDLRSAFQDVKVHGFRDVIKVQWEPMKFDGKAENTYGDIAILVNVSLNDGSFLEGVAFLEAKVKNPNSGSFNALKKTQLQRLASNTPHSQLLMYDFEPIVLSQQAVDFQAYEYDFEYEFVRRRYHNKLPYTQTATIPTNTALAIDKKTTALYQCAVPLSYQIPFRFFLGLDLDFTKKAVDTAKGFFPSKGIPHFLLNLQVVHGRGEPRKPNINGEIFKKLFD